MVLVSLPWVPQVAELESIRTYPLRGKAGCSVTNRVTRWLGCLTVVVVVSAATTSIAVAAVVGPVTNMSVTPGDKQMAISWTAPAVGANPAISDYFVEYTSDRGATWNQFLHNQSSGTSITVTGLTNGVPYTFRVTPVNSDGHGSTAEYEGTPVSSHTPAHKATYSACPTGAAPAAGFTDITLAAVDCIKYYGITKGTTATTYSPGGSVTRLQMALFLTRMAGPAGITLGSGSDQGFTDITGEAAEFQTAINQIKQLGITTGKTATTYDPHSFVTREEMALFLTRLLKEATVGPGGHSEYVSGASGPKEIKSNDSDHNFLDLTGMVLWESTTSIINIWNLGITEVATAQSYEPLRKITRKEMAIMMTNALGQTNARPAGLSIQDDLIRSTQTQRMISVTHRTADFQPVVGTIVDTFRFTHSPVTTTIRFTTTGACSSTDPTAVGSVECKVDSADPITDSNGNLAIFAESLPTYSLVDFWAWTAATGTTYDNDLHAASAATVTLETIAG